MSKTLRVTLTCEPSPEMIHRFRSAGEDIWRALQASYSVSLAEIDGAKTMFSISDVRARRTRIVTQQVLDLLKRHGFADYSGVSVEAD